MFVAVIKYGKIIKIVESDDCSGCMFEYCENCLDTCLGYSRQDGFDVKYVLVKSIMNQQMKTNELEVVVNCNNIVITLTDEQIKKLQSQDKRVWYKDRKLDS